MNEQPAIHVPPGEPQSPVQAAGKLGPQTDPIAYRSVILTLGAVIIIVVIGGIILAAFGKDLPQGVLAIGSAAVGGLVGLLAPSPKQSEAAVRQ